MELQTIVDRYAEAMTQVDLSMTSAGVNARTKVPYQVGFKSLNEEPAMNAVDAAWEALHPGERQVHLMGVPYRRIPGKPALPAAAAIDHVLTTDGLTSLEDEWGIEVKRLQFVGDNGKRNDFATTKVLSPYLKDRGMLHDAARLREYGFTRRIAIVGYCFDHDEETILESRTHHTSATALSTINEIERIVSENGPLLARPLIEFADAILGLRGYSIGPRAQTDFEAWRHPAGGRGVVFGWEIRRPWLEPNYDVRHPW